MTDKLITHEVNPMLKQAREVYKNREEEFYLETIRKTADELERIITQNEQFAKDVARYFELLYISDDKLTGKMSEELALLEQKLSKGVAK